MKVNPLIRIVVAVVVVFVLLTPILQSTSHRVLAQAAPTNTPEPRPTETPRDEDEDENGDGSEQTREPTATPTVVIRISPTPTRVSDPLFPELNFQGPPTLDAGYPPAPTQAFSITDTIPFYDIVITGVEITQGIQNMNNDMTLVFHRQTVVRVYFEIIDLNFVPGNEAKNAFRIEGAMKVVPAANVVTPPTLEMIPGQAVYRPQGNWGDDDTWSSNRVLYSSTVNFILPKDWAAGKMEYEIFIWGNEFTKGKLGPETNFTNNRYNLSAEYLGGVANPKLIVYTMHNHLEGESDQPVRDLFTPPADAIRGLYRYFPISEVTLLSSPLFYLRPIGHPQNGHALDWDPDEKGEVNKEADRLAWIKNNSNGYPSGKAVLWYGMVHDNVDLNWWNADDVMLDIGGLALGGVAVGYMNAPTLAHEGGHIFGLKHILCAGNEEDGGSIDPDFPYIFPECSLWEIDPNGFYGLDMEQIFWGSSDPNLHVISNDPVMEANLGYPLMSYAGSPWIDPLHYCKVMNNLGGFCPFSDIGLAGLNNTHLASLDLLPPLHGDVDDTPPDYLVDAEQFLLVSGVYNLQTDSAIFYQAQVQTELTDNAWQTATDSAGERHNRAENGLLSPYRLALVDAAGAELFSLELFDANYLSTHEDGQSVAFFDVLPFDTSAAALVILDDADRELARRVVSSNAPSVTILTPNEGGTVSLPLELTWSGSDPDGDELTYMIQYSPDMGVSWITLISDYPEQSALLERTDGLQSSATGLFRVVANDGLLSGSDVTDAALTLPNNLPVLYILGPDNQSVYATNARVTLRGQAADWEDGDLPEDAFIWHSDVDGVLGSGTELITFGLTPGIHRITLTVTDSAYAQGESFIYIAIDPNVVDETYDPDTLEWARQVIDGELVLDTSTSPEAPVVGTPNAQPADSRGLPTIMIVLVVVLGAVGVAYMVLRRQV